MLEFFEKNLPFLIVVSIVASFVIYSVRKERKEEEEKDIDKKDIQKKTEKTQGTNKKG